VLDVATGTGNIAIRAAAGGAQVVGLDLTPELFGTAQRRAEERGVAVDWVEGDAEELPFDDERFDRVLSAFGVQFAPRHEIVARELARVCRPGGRIGLVNWTPESPIGELFKIMSRYLPPAPDYASAPPLWGSEQHLHGLFAGTGVELEFARGHNPFRFDSPEHFVAFMEIHYGPTLKARERLTAEGRWEQCRAEIVAMAERRNEATDGSLLLPAEYLIVTGHKAGHSQPRVSIVMPRLSTGAQAETAGPRRMEQSVATPPTAAALSRWTIRSGPPGFKSCSISSGHEAWRSRGLARAIRTRRSLVRAEIADTTLAVMAGSAPRATGAHLLASSWAARIPDGEL
jgi:SAM-dependent methyltransferase